MITDSKWKAPQTWASLTAVASFQTHFSTWNHRQCLFCWNSWGPLGILESSVFPADSTTNRSHTSVPIGSDSDWNWFCTVRRIPGKSLLMMSCAVQLDLNCPWTFDFPLRPYTKPRSAIDFVRVQWISDSSGAYTHFFATFNKKSGSIKMWKWSNYWEGPLIFFPWQWICFVCLFFSIYISGFT